MITTEERAAADEHIDYSSTPELDRRVMRCRCGHSLSAHRPPPTPGDAMLLPEPRDAFRLPPCLRCDCQRYTSRPAVWRVTLVRPITVELALRPWTFWAPVWIVTSPRGVEVCRLPNRVAALNLARMMADLDQLLARANNIEQAASIERVTGFWHPSQGTPPPDSLSTPVVLTVVGGGR